MSVFWIRTYRRLLLRLIATSLSIEFGTGCLLVAARVGDDVRSVNDLVISVSVVAIVARLTG